MTTWYACQHHGNDIHTTEGDAIHRTCAHDGTVHYACAPRRAPHGTPRPADWPTSLDWITEGSTASVGDDFDFEAVARAAYAEAVTAGDTRAAHALAACLPRSLTPEEQRRAVEAAWSGVIRNSSFGKLPPGVTRIR
jgi:hypothetical protein